MRRLWIALLATLLACEFPRPVDVLGGGDGDAGGSGADGGDDAGGALKLGTFSIVGNSTLPKPRRFHAFVLQNKRLSLVGGLDDSTGIEVTIEHATFDTNDAISAFTRSPNQISDSVTGMGVAVVGDTAFLLGGSLANNNTVTKIHRALLGADGSLASFTVAAQTLASSRALGGAVNTGTFVYFFGGQSNLTQLSSVERAGISGTTLGSFSDVPGVSLVATNSHFATVVVGTSVYVLGGVNGATPRDTVQRATINADGSLSTFTDTGNHLVTPRFYSAAVVFDGAVYVIGGTVMESGLDSVERATINADNSLGPFTKLTDIKLAVPRFGHSAHVVGNSIYVVGGETNALTFLDSVERAVAIRGG